jgi:hypothetical protein
MLKVRIADDPDFSSRDGTEMETLLQRAMVMQSPIDRDRRRRTFRKVAIVVAVVVLAVLIAGVVVGYLTAT